jgi:hypothetical protein
VQALQYPPEHAMTLQIQMENHTVEDRIVAHTTESIVARTDDRTVEVVV